MSSDYLIPPNAAALVDRIDGAVFRHYAEPPEPTATRWPTRGWSVYSIPASAVACVERLGGRPYDTPGRV